MSSNPPPTLAPALQPFAKSPAHDLDDRPSSPQTPSSSSTRYAPHARFSSVLEDPRPAPPPIPRSDSPTDSEHGGPAFTPLTGSAVNRPSPPVSSSSTLVKGLDIEHTVVENDPRLWSDRKKLAVLIMVSCGSITPTLGAVSRASSPLNGSPSDLPYRGSRQRGRCSTD